MRRPALLALAALSAAGVLLVASEEPRPKTSLPEDTAVTAPVASPAPETLRGDQGQKPPSTLRVETATFALG